jgi:hypothetical protein
MTKLHDASRFEWVGVLGRMGWRLCWLGALALGCDDAGQSALCNGPGPCDDTYESLFEPDDLAESSCDTLDEDDCRAAGHCILDMRCAPQASCAGPNCGRGCELIEACVPY